VSSILTASNLSYSFSFCSQTSFRFCVSFSGKTKMIRRTPQGLTYTEYMKSASWMVRRSEWWKGRRRQCSICRSKKRLHLHHVTYERLGFELDSDLVALCEDCHDGVHNLIRARKKGITLANAHKVYRPPTEPKPVKPLTAKQLEKRAAKKLHNKLRKQERKQKKSKPKKGTTEPLSGFIKKPKMVEPITFAKRSKPVDRLGIRKPS